MKVVAKKKRSGGAGVSHEVDPLNPMDPARARRDAPAAILACR